ACGVLSSAARIFSFSVDLATRTRRAPRAAIFLANSSPRPEDAPVTSAVLPVHSVFDIRASIVVRAKGKRPKRRDSATTSASFLTQGSGTHLKGTIPPGSLWFRLLRREPALAPGAGAQADESVHRPRSPDAGACKQPNLYQQGSSDP